MALLIKSLNSGLDIVSVVNCGAGSFNSSGAVGNLRSTGTLTQPDTTEDAPAAPSGEVVSVDQQLFEIQSGLQSYKQGLMAQGTGSMGEALGKYFGSKNTTTPTATPTATPAKPIR